MSVVVTTGVSQGPQGPAGNDSVFTSVDSLTPNPRSVTDWGPILNTAFTAGARHFVFGEYDYPFSTALQFIGGSLGQSTLLEGSRGRSWYVGSNYDAWGSRLIWTGAASPTVTRTDGAILSGSHTLNSASGPWTQTDNVYYNGQPITIQGAGPGGADLVTQITSRSSSTQVSVLDAASTTVSAATFSFTDWVSTINARGSTGFQIRDMKLIYTDTAFDGILLDMRSGFTWSSRGLIRDCMISGFGNATAAYALVHINGMGETFSAKGTSFGLAKACVRGHYNNNADDAVFEDCSFTAFDIGAIVNPGRYWAFRSCVFNQAAYFQSGTSGAAFITEGQPGVAADFVVDRCSFWDYEQTGASDGSMTNGSVVLTTSGSHFTRPAYCYIGHPFFVAGAGTSGGTLRTKVKSVQSATQITLVDAASTAVSGAQWTLQDMPGFSQGPQQSWILTVRDAFSWFEPEPMFDLQGPGSLNLENWTSTRQIRRDGLGLLTKIDLGPAPLGPSSPAYKSWVSIRNCALNSPNLALTDDVAIKNAVGHNIREINGVLYTASYKTLPLASHETLEGNHWGGGELAPSIAAAVGQTFADYGINGNDMMGYIVAHATGSGFTAGDLVDITFGKPWPTLQSYFPVNGNGLLVIHLTPFQYENSSGPAAVAAGAYAIQKSAPNSGYDTGWSLAISNTVPANSTVAWSYRVTRT